MDGRHLFVFALALAAALATVQEPAGCDFESPSLCGYTQDTHDNFDWVLKSGPTSSTGTGPSTDHTTGTTAGHYVYIEASAPRQRGDRAVLFSPVLSTLGTGEQRCITFWYNMHGAEMGTLKVGVRLPTGNHITLWSLSGDQGNVWKFGRASLYFPNSTFQVFFEGVVGAGMAGDIAIDDVSVARGHCSYQPTNAQPESVTTTRKTTTVPSTRTPPQHQDTVTCNFDFDMCSWVPLHDDQFGWKRHSGRTPSVGTGPTHDHTTGNDFYIYAEASATPANHSARIQSKTIMPQEDLQCLSFWYHMFGDSIGTLNFYIKTGSGLGTPVWTQTGSQGNQWMKAEVTVSQGRTSYAIVLEAVRGNGPQGDIAIDDVSVKPGSCGQSATLIPSTSGPGATAVPVPTFCGFESPSLCGYTQDTHDDFNWVRHAGSTASTGTGPSMDHTIGTSQGHYVYVEASAPRQRGDRAVLFSLVLSTLGTGEQRCITFWYNMHGAEMGTLNVGVRLPTGNHITLWSLSGDQGSSWNFGRASLNFPNSTFQVFFEGVVGAGMAGDIAIDDVSVDRGRCSHLPFNAQPMPVTTTRSKPSTVPSTRSPRYHQDTVTCNFDSDMCGWVQLHDDQFDWVRHSGSTLSVGTGPAHDHTTGNGFYIYTEVSAVPANYSARIQSKTIMPREDLQCLSFWYHMFGDSIGTLNLYIKTGSGLGTPVWTQTGSQGNQWMKAEVTLNQGRTSYALVIEGIAGNGYRGDIAVDDVLLGHGACTGTSVTPGPDSTMAPGGVVRTCDFEADLCGYTQDKTDNFDWSRNTGSTPSSATGPSSDHTYGTLQGHYMYIESSDKSLGDKARLVSPVYTDKSSMCLQFYYHMYGSGIGELNVYTMQSSSSMTNLPLFTRSGNQGNRWIVGQVTIPQTLSSTGYKVVFEAITGSTYMGDIAIDDVSILQGPCPIPGNCDFESGLCTWMNTHQGDDFDWTIMSGRTGSAGTGPVADHTRGDATGKYVYIETSSPRVPGDKAWLVSENFAPVSGSGRCLHFWYSMYGSTVGTMTVYLRRAGYNDTLIWRLNGQQGQSWRNGQVSIPRINTNYCIVFEGMRGQSYTGDIALDDISFTDSPCGGTLVTPGPGSTGSTVAPGGMVRSCDFEANFCGYTQEQTDNFDWSRNTGSTPSSASGPSSDHTYGTLQGHYMYIESSDKRLGDKARLVSPVYTDKSSMCLQFYYHMYGSGIGELNVYTMQSSSNMTNLPLFTRSGNQGNRWIVGQVTIPQTLSSTGYKVVFEAITGSTYMGDIAIDDVSILQGPCPIPGNCHFESGLCTWMNTHQGDDFDWTIMNGRTSTAGTGPIADHTRGDATGKYVYIETSSPQAPGDKAWLVSENFAPVSGSGRCLHFWYSMYGSTVGTMTVYLRRAGYNDISIWRLNGQQGQAWQNGQVSIPRVNTDYSIVFEGVRGQSYTGDIALDDISFTDSPCGVIPSTAAPTSSTSSVHPPLTTIPNTGPFDCTFDSNMCGWVQDESDQFDWTRFHGTTPSVGTGPTDDHTQANHGGYYVYIETSGRHSGDKARLISPNVGSGQYCLTFWYFMYGQDVDHLNVYLMAGSSLSSTPLWTLQGDQGRQWRRANVGISAVSSTFNVVFEAIRGSTYMTEIAIDDVSILPGPCDNPGWRTTSGAELYSALPDSTSGN